MNKSILSFDGYRYSYKVVGNVNSNCTPIYFISGAFQNMETWRRFESHYTPVSKVILSDLPGVGSADILPSSYSFDFIAQSIKHLLDHLEIDKINILAASYGTPTGLLFCANYPERVKKAIFVGAALGFSSEINREFKQHLKDVEQHNIKSFSEYVTKYLLNYNYKDKIERFKLAERILLKSVSSMSEEDIDRYIQNTRRVLNYQQIAKTIKEIKVNALLITGKYDSFTPVKEAKKVMKILSNSTLTIVDQADHMVHVERYNKLLEIFDAFYKEYFINEQSGLYR